MSNISPKYNQYVSEGLITTIYPNAFMYNADTSSGMSGGPVIDERNNAVGIHVYDSETEGNMAVKITDMMCYYFNKTITENP